MSGEPVPGTYSEEEELAALMAVMAEVGSGVLQVVPAGVGGAMGGDQRHSIDAEIEWITRLGRQYGIPLTFLAMVNEQDPHDWRHWFAAVHEANAAGAAIRPQAASRAFGMLMGHQSRMNPFRHRPTYRPLMELPLGQRIRAFNDCVIRRSGRKSWPRHPTRRHNPPPTNSTSTPSSACIPSVKRSTTNPRARTASPPSPSARAVTRGRSPTTCCSAPEGREFLLLPLLNYAGNNYDDLHDMMSDPVSLQGLGDGGAHCGIICDARLAVYVAAWSTIPESSYCMCALKSRPCEQTKSSGRHIARWSCPRTSDRR